MTLDRAGERDLLCVAGGTGLAPLKAIIEQAIRESSACPRHIFLFYGARTRAELHELPDLYRLADAYPGFTLTPVTSDDPAFDGMQGNVGRVAARYLPHRECEAYVAGPAAMVRETIGVLARAGIPPERIHYDDALLAADKPVSPPPARGETEQTGDASVAEPVPQDQDAPNSETSGDLAEQERVSAGHRPAPLHSWAAVRQPLGAIAHNLRNRVLVPEEPGLEDAIGVGPVEYRSGAGTDGRVDP
jgi:hypothetical protein